MKDICEFLFLIWINLIWNIGRKKSGWKLDNKVWEGEDGLHIILWLHFPIPLILMFYFTSHFGIQLQTPVEVYANQPISSHTRGLVTLHQVFTEYALDTLLP